MAEWSEAELDFKLYALKPKFIYKRQEPFVFEAAVIWKLL